MPVRGKLQGDDERCEQVQRVLEGMGIMVRYGWRQVRGVHTLRKGLPRFVVFIM